MQTTATRSIHMIPGKVVGIYLGKTLIERELKSICLFPILVLS